MRLALPCWRGIAALLGLIGALALAGCDQEPVAAPTPLPSPAATPLPTDTPAPSTPSSATNTPEVVISVGPSPGVTGTPPAGPDAWVQARGALPPSVVVLRPTWLPEGFLDVPQLVYAENASGSGPMYKITYTSSRGDVLGFVLGAENTAPPDTQEAITVRGIPGQLFSTAAASPRLWASWNEGPNLYQVLAYGAQNPLTRDDLLRIIGSLTPVT